MSEFSISPLEIGNGLRIVGELDVATAPRLGDALTDTASQSDLVLDLSGVTFLDSSGLGQLVGSYATAVSHGSEIKLLNLNKKVYDLMQITKLYTVFAIYTDESTAIESFEVAA